MAVSLLLPTAQTPSKYSLAQKVGVNLHRPSARFPVVQEWPVRLRRVLRSLVPPLGSTLNGVVHSHDAYQGMQEWFEIELRVRDYELDQYGAVNKAVYSSYCQHGHEELIKSIGINPVSVVEKGEALALSELKLKFLGLLESEDRFVLKVRISEMSIARVILQTVIVKLPDQQKIMEANATAVWLGRNHRPVRLPIEVREKISGYMRDTKLGQCTNGHINGIEISV